MAQKYKYAVIGSGMQGTAEGYDLACYGNASQIIMVDIDKNAALRAADRINRLTGINLASGVKLDAHDEHALVALLSDVDVCCGAAHYALNLPLTRACIKAESHYCDMGGNTGVVQKQHELDLEAQRQGVTIVPDCGLAPGLANILAARSLKQLDCEDIQIRCGGLPQNPKPPLDYRIVFSVAGLTNEYTGNCVEIRDHCITEVPAFTELESLEFQDPVGKCEAFLTSGGTSTGPWSFLGKVKNYGYKTVRYSGHYIKMRAMIDLGFLDLDPIPVGQVEIIPREVFHVLAKSRLAFPEDKDLVVLRVTSSGVDKSGKKTRMIQEMMDFQDDRTGFTAMERTTAFSASIVAIMLAQGELPTGVKPLELIVDGDRCVTELAKRNIIIHTDFHPIDS